MRFSAPICACWLKQSQLQRIGPNAKEGMIITMKTDLTPMFKNKKVILVGAGITNRPLASMLAEMGAEIEIRDRKTRDELANAKELEDLGAKLVLGEDYLSPMEADFVFRTPGIRPDTEAFLLARERGAQIVSEMGLFLTHAPCPVIAVTGSDGKSTTTTLIYEILKASGRKAFLGGNIGEPLLHRISDMTEKDIVSAELSSFQLMDIDAPVSVAVIKNITPNHLNWHKDMEEYTEAKAMILLKCKKAVLNYDDPTVRGLASRCSCPITWFSRSPIPKDFLKNYSGAVYEANGFIVYYDSASGSEEKLVALSDVLLPGKHNIENYSTAIAATLDFAKKEDFATVAKSFRGVRHRLELVCEKNGVKFYNSSIDSSPTRTAAAISALTLPINIICGGYDKNIPFEPLAEALIKNKYIKSITLTGATMEKIKACITAHPDFRSSGIRLECEKDFRAATLLASSLAKSGECVLLSPACASFDAFENFERRGEFFAKTVNEI